MYTHLGHPFHPFHPFICLCEMIQMDFYRFLLPTRAGLYRADSDFLPSLQAVEPRWPDFSTQGHNWDYRISQFTFVVTKLQQIIDTFETQRLLSASLPLIALSALPHPVKLFRRDSAIRWGQKLDHLALFGRDLQLSKKARLRVFELLPSPPVHSSGLVPLNRHSNGTCTKPQQLFRSLMQWRWVDCHRVYDLFLLPFTTHTLLLPSCVSVQFGLSVERSPRTDTKMAPRAKQPLGRLSSSLPFRSPTQCQTSRRPRTQANNLSEKVTIWCPIQRNRRSIRSPEHQAVTNAVRLVRGGGPVLPQGGLASDEDYAWDVDIFGASGTLGMKNGSMCESPSTKRRAHSLLSFRRRGKLLTQLPPWGYVGPAYPSGDPILSLQPKLSHRPFPSQNPESANRRGLTHLPLQECLLRDTREDEVPKMRTDRALSTKIRFTHAGNGHEITSTDAPRQTRRMAETGMPDSTLNAGSVRQIQRKAIPFPGDDLLAFLAPAKTVNAAFVPGCNLQAPFIMIARHHRMPHWWRANHLEGDPTPLRQLGEVSISIEMVDTERTGSFEGYPILEMSTFFVDGRGQQTLAVRVETYSGGKARRNLLWRKGQTIDLLSKSVQGRTFEIGACFSTVFFPVRAMLREQILLQAPHNLISWS
ncbi:hypothetical protein BKA70DRAFT_1218346 [Coprinopsis sp. MPI-PUGE-AT-0042]|nr:hypothetical protein BKA70DRAFT_1218346 [Coprinopsis sp. MPI-PUGE-AT-0042]